MPICVTTYWCFFEETYKNGSAHHPVPGLVCSSSIRIWEGNASSCMSWCCAINNRGTYYCYYGGMFSPYVAFLFALCRHEFHCWNTLCTLLKDTSYTIYNTLFEIHCLHYLHYWNTLFAAFTLLKYTICTIYTVERHYLRYLHNWFARLTRFTLSSHLIHTICSIWHTLFALLALSRPPYFHNGDLNKINALLRKINALQN